MPCCKKTIRVPLLKTSPLLFILLRVGAFRNDNVLLCNDIGGDGPYGVTESMLHMR